MSLTSLAYNALFATPATIALKASATTTAPNKPFGNDVPNNNP